MWQWAAGISLGILLFFSMQSTALAGIPTTPTQPLTTQAPPIIEPFTLPKVTPTPTTAPTPAPILQPIFDYFANSFQGVKDFFGGSKVIADSNAQAAVLVEHSNGEIKTACVSFTEENISGLELLKRANIAVVESGGMVSSIDGEVAPAYDAANPKYWSYFHGTATDWAMSTEGAGTAMIANGELDGWKLGGGEKPTFKSVEEICSAAAQKTQTVVPIRAKAQSTTNIPWMPILIVGIVLLAAIIGWIWFFRIKNKQI